MPVSSDIYSMVGRGVQPVEDPQNALLKALKLQGAQQELQSGSMKMDEYRRGVERNNKLQQLLSGDYADDELRAGALVKGGFFRTFWPSSKKPPFTSAPARDSSSA